jgi:hypothetical protein
MRAALRRFGLLREGLRASPAPIPEGGVAVAEGGRPGLFSLGLRRGLGLGPAVVLGKGRRGVDILLIVWLYSERIDSGRGTRQ